VTLNLPSPKPWMSAAASGRAHSAGLAASLTPIGPPGSGATPIGPPGSGATPIGPPGAGATPIGPPGAGATPIGPPGSGATPIGPPGSGATPIGPPGSGATPIGPPGAGGAAPFPAVPTPAPFPLPWQDIDPRWVYSDANSLLGQALRRSRAKIVRPADGLLAPSVIAESAQRGWAVQGSHLWRWARPFRVSAVQAELQGRFQVRGGRLWLIDPGAAAAPAPVASLVFEVARVRGAQVFDAQVDKVLRAAVEREDRLPEILSQTDDFWPFFESIIGVSLRNAPRLAELLEVAHGVAVHVAMALKHGIAARRPAQCSSLVMPVIATPGHGALPSGHATLAAMQAELLAALLYPSGGSFAKHQSTQLDRLVRRIAFNRVVAGVHFPLDSLAGYALGCQLARLLHGMSRLDIKPEQSTQHAPAVVDDKVIESLDADLELKELGNKRLPSTKGNYRLNLAPEWAEMWRRTRAELAELRV
jgi:membrane-associated phospholipid phosphatase